jgi:hypothetical protein
MGAVVFKDTTGMIANSALLRFPPLLPEFE